MNKIIGNIMTKTHNDNEKSESFSETEIETQNVNTVKHRLTLNYA